MEEAATLVAVSFLVFIILPAKFDGKTRIL